MSVIVRSVFLSLCILSPFALEAKDLLLKSETPFTWSLLDQEDLTHVLIRHKDGNFSVFDSQRKGLPVRYSGHCGLGKYGAEALVYVHPYLVGLESSCALKEETKSMVELAPNKAAKDSYAMAFLGRDANSTYFVMNSRPFNPPAPAGFVHVKAVDHRSGKISVKMVLDKVPGYSGAMALDLDQRTLLYTEATGGFSNVLHSMDSHVLIDHFNFGTSTAFSNAGTKIFSFPGLSFWLTVSEEGLLYGDQNEPYFIHRKTGQKSPYPLEKSCAVVGFSHGKLLTSCADSAIYSH